MTESKLFVHSSKKTLRLDSKHRHTNNPFIFTSLSRDHVQFWQTEEMKDISRYKSLIIIKASIEMKISHKSENKVLDKISTSPVKLNIYELNSNSFNENHQIDSQIINWNPNLDEELKKVYSISRHIGSFVIKSRENIDYRTQRENMMLQLESSPTKNHHPFYLFHANTQIDGTAKLKLMINYSIEYRFTKNVFLYHELVV